MDMGGVELQVVLGLGTDSIGGWHVCVCGKGFCLISSAK